MVDGKPEDTGGNVVSKKGSARLVKLFPGQFRVLISQLYKFVPFLLAPWRVAGGWTGHPGTELGTERMKGAIGAFWLV
jgi:hypothetical protein